MGRAGKECLSVHDSLSEFFYWVFIIGMQEVIISVLIMRTWSCEISDLPKVTVEQESEFLHPSIYSNMYSGAIHSAGPLGQCC